MHVIVKEEQSCPPLSEASVLLITSNEWDSLEASDVVGVIVLYVLLLHRQTVVIELSIKKTEASIRATEF